MRVLHARAAVAAHDLLARDPDPADADVREALASTIPCRCTGYEKIT
jgi:carbon-monoxide dehydrogenase small subunit